MTVGLSGDRKVFIVPRTLRSVRSGRRSWPAGQNAAGYSAYGLLLASFEGLTIPYRFVLSTLFSVSAILNIWLRSSVSVGVTIKFSANFAAVLFFFLFFCPR